MDTLEICYMSAGDLSKLVKNKEVSPVEIIDAHLTRIEATEPVLNSFITLLAEESRPAARQAEKDIQAGRYKGPLHGIPVGLKDLYNTAGVRTTSGSKIFDTFVPEEDCTVAAKFQQAGAIGVGRHIQLRVTVLHFPVAARIRGVQDDRVMTYRPAVVGIDEENRGQQLTDRNLGLSPAGTLVI